MAVFRISFSEGKVEIPSSTFEASTIEEALETAWKANAPGLERADATALGVGFAYRFRRNGGRWQMLASHPVPEMQDSYEDD